MVLLNQSRRTYNRVPVGLSIPYRFDQGHATAWEEGAALNLSAGGVLLGVRKPDEPLLGNLLAERAKVCLSLPLGDRELLVMARVAWTDAVAGRDECRLGLKFLDLPTSDQEFVWQWVLGHQGDAAE